MHFHQTKYQYLHLSLESPHSMLKRENADKKNLFSSMQSIAYHLPLPSLMTAENSNII